MMSACANLKLFILDNTASFAGDCGAAILRIIMAIHCTKKDTERYVYSFIYLSKLAFRILLAFSKTFFYIKNTIHDEMFLLQCLKLALFPIREMTLSRA